MSISFFKAAGFETKPFVGASASTRMSRDQVCARAVLIVEVDLVDKGMDRFAPGQITLEQLLVQTAGLPGGIVEAFVARLYGARAFPGDNSPEVAHEREPLLDRDLGLADRRFEDGLRRVDKVAAAHSDHRIERERVLRRFIRDRVSRLNHLSGVFAIERLPLLGRLSRDQQRQGFRDQGRLVAVLDFNGVLCLDEKLAVALFPRRCPRRPAIGRARRPAPEPESAPCPGRS